MTTEVSVALTLTVPFAATAEAALRRCALSVANEASRSMTVGLAAAAFAAEVASLMRVESTTTTKYVSPSISPPTFSPPPLS